MIGFTTKYQQNNIIQSYEWIENIINEKTYQDTTTTSTTTTNTNTNTNTSTMSGNESDIKTNNALILLKETVKILEDNIEKLKTIIDGNISTNENTNITVANSTIAANTDINNNMNTNSFIIDPSNTHDILDNNDMKIDRKDSRIINNNGTDTNITIVNDTNDTTTTTATATTNTTNSIKSNTKNTMKFDQVNE
jgi:hypothetical protein